MSEKPALATSKPQAVPSHRPVGGTLSAGEKGFDKSFEDIGPRLSRLKMLITD